MNSALRTLLISIGYDMDAFAVLWRQDVTRWALMAEIADHFEISDIDLSDVDPALVRMLLKEDLTTMEILTLIVSRLRTFTGGDPDYPVFTDETRAAFGLNDYTVRDILLRLLVMVGVTETGPLFRYSAGYDWQAMGGTFARASLATYMDDEQMVAYAPHNFSLYSQDLQNAGWQVAAGVVKGATVIGPTGQMDGISVDFTGTVAASPFYHFPTDSVSAIHTFSVWVRAVSGTQPFTLDLNGDGVYYARVASTTWQKFEAQSVPGNLYQAVIRSTGATGVLEVAHPQTERNISASETYIPTTGAARFDGLRDQHYAFDNPSETYVQSTLLEGQRTNLVLYSQEFGTDKWTTSTAGPVTLDTTVAPDGSTTADTIVMGDNYHCQTVSAASGTYAFSIWLKGTPGNVVGIRIAGTDDHQRAVTLTSSWVRYSIAGPITTGGTMVCGLENRSSVVPGSGTAGTFQAWGAQLEAGAFASSYIPTVASAVTRAADVPVIPIDFDSQELTMFVRMILLGGEAGNPRLIQLGNDSGDPRTILYEDSLLRSTVYHNSSVAGVASLITPGDSVEVRSTISENGSPTVGQTINSGVEQLSATAIPGGLAPYNEAKIYIGHSPTGGTHIFSEFRDIIIAKGVKDLAYFRGLITIPPPPIPENTDEPSLDNLAPSEGQPITVNVGAWAHSPTSFAYQWYYNDGVTGFVPIVGQTEQTYFVLGLASGTEISATVRGINAGGSSAEIGVIDLAVVV